MTDIAPPTRRYDYERDGRAIYRESFATIRREVTLDHLPDPVEPVPDASIALMQAIMRLPRKLMEAVWLYYSEDMNMKDIGDMLGVAATTVGYRLDKARTLLRCRLGGGHPDEK